MSQSRSAINAHIHSCGYTQKTVVNENDQVVFLVARHVGHGAFARLGAAVLRPAKGVLLKHLPAVAGHQLADFYQTKRDRCNFSPFP